jgi:ribokinase
VGSLNADLVLQAPRLPRLGETLTTGDLLVLCGGKGANQAYAAAKLGGSVSMIGAVGSDAFGPMLRQNLESAGVDCSGVTTSPRATGVAAITVMPGGENTILVSPGANHDLPVERVTALLLESLEAAGLLLCQLEIPMEVIVAALGVARARGAQSMLDPAPAQALDPQVLALIDILTPNQTEIALLLGKPEQEPASVADAIEAANQLRRLGAHTVVVKLGRLGAVWVSARETIVAPGFAVDAVDSTAAGDTFNAALAVALAGERRGGIAEALEFANAAAAISVTRVGAQSSCPGHEDVAQLLSLSGRKAADVSRS